MRRHVVLAQHLAAVGGPDLDQRLLLVVGRVDDDAPGQAGDLVDFLVHRDAVDDVLELGDARFLGEDRERVRVPLEQDRADVDRRTVGDPQLGAVDHLVALAIATLRVLDHDAAGAVHHHHVAGRRRDRVDPFVAGDARVPRFLARLLRDARGRAADVERAHRQLRAGLADRLGGDDADREAELDQLAGREVAPVALGADAAPRGAGQHRADLDLLDAGVLDRRRQLLGDLAVLLEHELLRERIVELLLGDAADDAVAQRLDDLAALDDRPRLDAVHRAAVDLVDDHVLRHVDEAAGQVARVRRLQRGVGQALARAVRRDEVLGHRQAFAEVGPDRRLDDLARRLGHQAAHARQLADLLLRAAGARVGHDVDRVEGAAGLVQLLHLAEHLVGDASRSPPTTRR